MNLYFRLLALLIKRLFNTPKADIFAPCETQFLVNPMDLDLNFHMNNGRYLSIMDLGRIDLMIKARVFWPLLSQGYYPVVTSESFCFRKSLGLFQVFQVVTKLDSWNEKDFFMTQKFFCHGELYGEGFIKARFKKRARKGSVATTEIFELAGQKYSGPQLSPLAHSQIAIEEQLAPRE